ncbi:MAG: Rid family hydrolase, partial [Anaerolineae bacterium]|nr:Rid family hydrolase [Anaerolineae bacterium]
MNNPQRIQTDQAPIPTTAYSQALRFGNFLVTSGYLGTAVDGSGVVKGGFEAEARQALNNI